MTTVFMLGSISCGAGYAFDHLSAGACCAVALLERALHISDRADILDQGRIVHQGDAKALLADSEIQEKYCVV
jgi:ABC-type branched-subunit amino acid transport system ATPase component